MTIEALPAIEVPGHRASSLGNEEHPMRVMTRRAAGLIGPAWDQQARAEVAGFFDALATEWHTRSSPERFAVVGDALARGLDPMNVHAGTAIEIGSGTGFYSDLLAERFTTAVAVELAFEMSQRAPSGPAVRVLADAATIPVSDDSIDAVVLINAFLFPHEVARILRPNGALVWINSSGSQTPIHLTTAEVVAALPFTTEGVESQAGAGSWVVLRRSS